MKKLTLPIVLLLLLTCNSFAQDLLSVNWQKIVCANGYIDNIEQILTDEHGNTYTLGSFPNEANLLGEDVTSDYGANFLLKQNPKGEKIFLKVFGNSRVNLAEGDMEFASNGDIIFSLDFRDSFYWDGEILVRGDVYRMNAIIIKTDSDFNLKWFKTFQKNTVHRITNLILDKEDNIYCNFRFISQLEVDGYKFNYDSDNYSDVFAKFDTAGKIQWARHFKGATNAIGMLGSFCDTCKDELIFIGGTGDSLLIDDVLYEKFSADNSPPYMCVMSLTGNISLLRFTDKRILGINAMKMYNNRLFFSGVYNDSMFIGELNSRGELEGRMGFEINERCYVTDFQISPVYGFLISGFYNQSFSLQQVKRKLPGEYDRGSFIASFNDSLKLNDCKFIDGHYYNLRRILIDSNIITGAGIFEGNCSFSNANIFGWNSDISVFRTTDLKPLPYFMPDSLPKPPAPETEQVAPGPFFVNVYPNPFFNLVNIKFSLPAAITFISLTDAAGKLIRDIEIRSINEAEYYMDAGNFPPGFYILHFHANQTVYTYKLVKIG